MKQDKYLFAPHCPVLSGSVSSHQILEFTAAFEDKINLMQGSRLVFLPVQLWMLYSQSDLGKSKFCNCLVIQNA